MKSTKIRNWMIGPFKKYKNPILRPANKKFEKARVFNPAAIIKEDTFYLFYRAEDVYNGISRIGLAFSKDGINFRRHIKNPIIDKNNSGEEALGCQDPRIVKIGNIYYLTYTAFTIDRKSSMALAISKDLINWKKKGIIMPCFKSGAILNKKINGKYIMYCFGSSHPPLRYTKIWLAYSNDLVHWKLKKEPVMEPRKGYFDSDLVEPGPSPLITKEGIFMIYNASDGVNYRPGMVIFSKNNPSRILKRTNRPILEITEDWEKIGEANDKNIIFAEALVRHKGRWYLYYGAADKYIGVAIA